MLNENNVIASVRARLLQQGWEITNFAHTSEPGIDIEAKRGEHRLLIEAKGETSSSVTSSRYGRLFDTPQCTVSFSTALFRAISMQRKHPEALVALALPENPYYRRYAREAWAIMRLAMISIFWVHPDGTVSTWDPESPVDEEDAA